MNPHFIKGIQIAWACLGLGLGFGLVPCRIQAQTTIVHAPSGKTPALDAKREGPSVLTDQGLQNLVAFTLAMNDIRFFHPSDEAAKADWDRVACEGIRAVEDARNAGELADRLRIFFAPIAPSVQFLKADLEPQNAPSFEGSAQIVRWCHVGCGLLPHYLYKSQREYFSAADYRMQAEASPELAPYDLGAGLKLWMSSLLSVDGDKRTLPRSEKQMKLRTDDLSADDRAVRLADIALAWGVFQHFYPYFDVTSVDWHAELEKALRAAAVDPDGKAFTHTLQAMLASLKDGHISVFTADQSTEDDTMARPPLVLAMVDGDLRVRLSLDEAQAIPRGSRITRIDGEPIEKCLARFRSEHSAASEGWMKSRIEHFMLAGKGAKAGSSVTLGYQSPEGIEREISLKRDADYMKLFFAPRPSNLCELKSGIWYVDLSRSREKEYAEIFPRLLSAKGIVFDLRGYPASDTVINGLLQHLATRPMQSARFNVPIVLSPDSRGLSLWPGGLGSWSWKSSYWHMEPQEPRIKAKTAFLIGPGAISAAESYLGIVEAYHLGELVGEPSAGTNGNVNRLVLPGGYKIPWTGMQVLKQDGSRHHGVGIRPTIWVRSTVQGLVEGRDEVLEKAIEVLNR